MARLDLTLLRRFGLAALRGIGAAGVELAAGRRVGRGRNGTLQHDALPLDRRVRDGNGREQRLGVGVQRVGKNVVGLAVLHQVAQVHNAHRVRDMLDNGQVVGDEQVGQLEKNQREMINNIFEFDDLDAGDIMTHRIDINALDCNLSIEKAVELAIEYGNSRLPVYDEDLDRICGVLYVKDLLKFVGKPISNGEKLLSYTRKPLFVPESMPCGKLFAKMTEARVMLAIVIDEYGGTAGLVTMEDILESIVGNICDEYDGEEEQSITKINDSTFTFDGFADIDDVSKALGIQIPDGDYDTIAGFVITLLGYLPSEDDKKVHTVKYDNLVFTVLDVKDRRIGKIKVEKVEVEK